MEGTKMKKNYNLEDLFNVLEKIRIESYPDIPKEVLIELIKIEYENLDNRSEAQKAVLNFLEDQLKQ